MVGAGASDPGTQRMPSTLEPLSTGSLDPLSSMQMVSAAASDPGTQKKEVVDKAGAAKVHPELDPDAKWVNLFHPMQDPGVLIAYALLFLSIFSKAPVKSHVQDPHNVTINVSTLSAMGNTFGTKFLSGILPGMLGVMFNPDFTAKSWTSELLVDLVRESESAAKPFVDSPGHD
jgi:hypothetical protein